MNATNNTNTAANKELTIYKVYIGSQLDTIWFTELDAKNEANIFHGTIEIDKINLGNIEVIKNNHICDLFDVTDLSGYRIY